LRSGSFCSGRGRDRCRFGQAAFVGIGAVYHGRAHHPLRYVALAQPAGSNRATAVIALFLGFITLRSSGHYLPLGTIAWGIAIYFLLGNLEWRGKYSGIAEIPPLTVLGVRLRGPPHVLLSDLGSDAARVARRAQPSGLALRACDPRAQSPHRHGGKLRRRPARLKIVVFRLCSGPGLLSGWLYAHFLRFISPQPSE